MIKYTEKRYYWLLHGCGREEGFKGTRGRDCMYLWGFFVFLFCICFESQLSPLKNMDNKPTTYRRIMQIKWKKTPGALCKWLITILIIGSLALKGYPQEMDWLVRDHKETERYLFMWMTKFCKLQIARDKQEWGDLKSQKLFLGKLGGVAFFLSWPVFSQEINPNQKSFSWVQKGTH